MDPCTDGVVSVLNITEVLPERCLSHTWTIFNGTGRWHPER
jgi:hypothetical protein